MSERPEEPEETRPFLAKPVSPSGDQSAQQPGPPPPYAQPNAQPYAPPPGGPTYQPYGAPGSMPVYPFAQAHQGANTAMGLGIASVVCALATFVICVSLPGVLCGPFAVVLALRAQKQMRENPGRYNNEGAAMTGLVTGIIGTVIGIAVFALVVFFFGFIFSVGSWATP